MNAKFRDLHGRWSWHHLVAFVLVLAFWLVVNVTLVYWLQPLPVPPSVDGEVGPAHDKVKDAVDELARIIIDTRATTVERATQIEADIRELEKRSSDKLAALALKLESLDRELAMIASEAMQIRGELEELNVLLVPATPDKPAAEPVTEDVDEPRSND